MYNRTVITKWSAPLLCREKEGSDMKKRIVKCIALSGMMTLCLTLTSCLYVPSDDLGGDAGLHNGGQRYQTVAVPTENPTTARPSDAPTPEVTFTWDNPTSVPTSGIGVYQPGVTATVRPDASTSAGATATTPRPSSQPTATPATVLEKGSQGDAVRSLQRRLKELGYLTGSVDGDFGDATEAAVKAFQDRNKLYVDGRAGEKTLAKLNSDSALKATKAPTNTPRRTATPRPQATATPNLSTNYYLENGTSGSRVRTLQSRLIELNWLSGTADGEYDSATEYAVKAFQARYSSLTKDGVAGPSTLQILYSNQAVRSSRPVASIGETLEEGKSGNAVRAMQTRLKELGYLAGSVDGSFGTSTKAAVIAFQKANNLTADGRAGGATLDKLYSTSAKDANSITADNPTGSVDSYTVLQEGDSGESVKALQRALKNKGYYSGSIDGKFGAATTQAVLAFQTQSGIRADGKAGPATQRALNAASVTNYRTLKPGDSGTEVRNLQYALAEKGYYSGTVDGSYGDATTQAVKAFQRRQGLTPVDGVAGEKTLTALYSSTALNKYATLRPGDSGTEVRTLQATLYELGYYDGSIDGIYGDTTKDSVRAFQIRNKVTPVDGIAGTKTQQRLYSSDAIADAAAITEYKTLRPGDKGDPVVQMQDNLQQLGYLATVTGVYDNATTAAVRAFQSRNGLSVDGNAGQNTLSKLYSGNAKPAY